MELEEIKQLVLDRLDLTQVVVKKDGGHIMIVAVGDIFNEIISPVKKQQYVLKAVSDKIADGTLHAVTVKTFTNEEWKKHSLFY